MSKVYNNGDVVTYNGQKCTVTRRNSMTLSNGRAMHRYNLRGAYGTFVDVVGEEVGAFIEDTSSYDEGDDE